jgi:hypothetical protein
MDIKIKIATDFSKTPGARYYKDGKKSGEEFFDLLLDRNFADAKNKNCLLIVDLDGTEGYATSFLDEAFRRLAEKYGAKAVLKTLNIVSNEEPDWVEEIQHYIKQDKPKYES